MLCRQWTRTAKSTLTTKSTNQKAPLNLLEKTDVLLRTCAIRRLLQRAQERNVKKCFFSSAFLSFRYISQIQPVFSRVSSSNPCLPRCFRKMSRKFEKLFGKWEEMSKEERYESYLKVEKEFESLPIVTKYKWNFDKPPNGPQSLLPNRPDGDKNPKIINDILIKSWETQGSYCPVIINRMGVLATNCGRQVSSWLMYYFRCLNVADNVSRVNGLYGADMETFKRMASMGFFTRELENELAFLRLASWLKIGNHVIDNMFSVQHAEQGKQSNEPLGGLLNFKYYDEDPGNSTFPIKETEPSPVGLSNERMVFGPDEKMEQNIAMGTLHAPTTLELYDVKMRKFIKEKYSVEIESLPLKWSKLCWNCFAKPSEEDLWKCARCRIAKYCSKECQVQDWKVHKLLHKVYVEYL